MSSLSLSQFRSFTITMFKVLLFISLAHLIKTILATYNVPPTEKPPLLLPGLLFSHQEVPRQKREELSPPAFRSFWMSNSPAGQTCMFTSPRPSINPIFHHQKKPYRGTTCPLRVLSFLLLRGRRLSAEDSQQAWDGAGTTEGGYQLLSDYWCDPKELCLV